jgi:hypothetical protein
VRQIFTAGDFDMSPELRTAEDRLRDQVEGKRDPR